MNMEEMQQNVATLAQITANLEAAVTDLEVRQCTPPMQRKL